MSTHPSRTLSPASTNPDQIPDHILPIQFFAVSSFISPEKKLLQAILEEAVSTLLKYGWMKGRRAERLTRIAWEWVDSPEEHYVCSFISICEALDLNPDRIRQGLHAKITRGVAPTIYRQGTLTPIGTVTGSHYHRIRIRIRRAA